MQSLVGYTAQYKSDLDSISADGQAAVLTRIANTSNEPAQLLLCEGPTLPADLRCKLSDQAFKT